MKQECMLRKKRATGKPFQKLMLRNFNGDANVYERIGTSVQKQKAIRRFVIPDDTNT